jgi:hypothetical protein
MDILTVLRDPITRSILAILAICFTLALFFVGQWWWRRKALTYTVSRTQLLTLHEEAKGRVQILFDGAPAKDVGLLVIEVNNSGHEPIRASDFERPLRFHLGDEAKILALEVIETKPQNLKPVCKAAITGLPAVVDGGAHLNEFELEPLLLNRGDWMKIKILVNQAGTLSVDGRVVGVREIRQVVPQFDWRLAALFTSAACFAVALQISWLDGAPSAFWSHVRSSLITITAVTSTVAAANILHTIVGRRSKE